MQQQTIQAMQAAAQGGQQFISAGEVTAAVVALLIGWGATEALKRVVYYLNCREFPEWLWPLTGFLTTLFVVTISWPVTGIFPHRWLAGFAIALSAPGSYKLLTWYLRRKGFGWVASLVSGNRRVSGKPRNGFDRRGFK